MKLFRGLLSGLGTMSSAHYPCLGEEAHKIPRRGIPVIRVFLSSKLKLLGSNFQRQRYKLIYLIIFKVEELYRFAYTSTRFCAKCADTPW